MCLFPSLVTGVLVRQLEGLNTKLQVIVPMTERRTILSHYHDNRTSAHLGLRKTLAKIRQGYYCFATVFASMLGIAKHSVHLV
jgi:hypothetical protein